jgi:hypothetical protein
MTRAPKQFRPRQTFRFREIARAWRLAGIWQELAARWLLVAEGARRRPPGAPLALEGAAFWDKQLFKKLNHCNELSVA